MLTTTNVLGSLRRGVIQYLIFSGLTVGAVFAQYVYRVPSPLLGVWLSWAGLALVSLVVLILINRVLDHPAADGTILTPVERWWLFAGLAILIATLFVPDGVVPVRVLRRVTRFALITIVLAVFIVAIRLAAPMIGPRARRALRRFEQGLGVVVGGFGLMSGLLFLNGYYDSSAAADVPSEVIAIGGGDLQVQVLDTAFFFWADLRSWRQPGRVERILLRPDEISLTWPGQPVIVRVRPGRLGIPWIQEVLRDREKYYTQVLAIAPTAAGPRRERLLWLVERQRWVDTVEAGREYLRLYPNDYDFMKGIAASLGVAGRPADAVALLEPFVARQPRNYELLNLVGWGLHQAGQTARGIEILERAVPLEPENWMAYYHLGYAYQAVGRNAEAIVAFEKALQIRGDYPEIVRQLRMLRKRVEHRDGSPDVG
jgi:tetratricopeptide (TPR) repeat protein